MADIIRIQSDSLKGLIQDHEDDREAATLRSTGFMELKRGAKFDPQKWRIEYLCDACHETVFIWSADTNDVIREVLKEKGILDADGNPAG